MIKAIERYNLTTQQVAQKFGYHINHVCLLAKTGKLPAIKRFRRWMFNEQEIMATFEKQTNLAVTRTDNANDAESNAKQGEGSDLLR